MSTITKLWVPLNQTKITDFYLMNDTKEDDDGRPVHTDEEYDLLSDEEDGRPVHTEEENEALSDEDDGRPVHTGEEYEALNDEYVYNKEEVYTKNQYNYPEEQWEQLDDYSKSFWLYVVFPRHNRRQINSRLKYMYCNHVQHTLRPRKQSSILITMIDIENIPLYMICYYIDAYKPNLNYHSFHDTALTVAIFRKRNDVVRMLVDMPGIDINKPILNTYYYSEPYEQTIFSKDSTPLMDAIACGNEEAVDILLNCKGIDVNYKNIYGQTALTMGPHIKRLYTHPGIQRPLSYINPTVEQHYHIPPDRLKVLGFTQPLVGPTILLTWPESSMTGPTLSDSADTQSYPYQYGAELCNAVMTNDTDTVGQLLAHENIDINYLAKLLDPFPSYLGDNYIERTALDIAISNNNLPIVQQLLQHPRIDVHNGSWFAEPIGLLEDQKFRRLPGKSPFHSACKTGSLAIVNCLLERPDIDVNKIDKISRSSGLCLAAEHGHIDVIRRLLDEPHIDVNYITHRGHATYIAIEHCHADITCMILTHKRAAPYLYRSVLERMAAVGSLKMVEFCLGLGKRDIPSAFRRCKSVAFLKAVEHNHIDIAKLLYDTKHFHTKYYKSQLQSAFQTHLSRHQGGDKENTTVQNHNRLQFIVQKRSIRNRSMLQFLVEKTSVDINGILCEEPSPLAAVILKNKMDAVLFLLEQPTMCDIKAILHVARHYKPDDDTNNKDNNKNTIALYLSMLIDRHLYTENTLHDAFCEFVEKSRNSPYIIHWFKLFENVPGFDVNRNNTNGKCPLDLAIRGRWVDKQNTDILQYLLRHPNIDPTYVENIYVMYYSLRDKLSLGDRAILQEYIYIRRECRALTELNLFGPYRALPTDVLRNIRDCLKGMSTPCKDGCGDKSCGCKKPIVRKKEPIVKKKEEVLVDDGYGVMGDEGEDEEREEIILNGRTYFLHNIYQQQV